MRGFRSCLTAMRRIGFGWRTSWANGSAEVIEAAPGAVVEALRKRYEQYRAMRLGRPAIKIRPERVTSWGDLG